MFHAGSGYSVVVHHVQVASRETIAVIRNAASTSSESATSGVDPW